MKPKPQRPGARAAFAAPLLLSLPFLPPGCKAPFDHARSDYDRSTPLARFRTIDTLNLDQRFGDPVASSSDLPPVTSVGDDAQPDPAEVARQAFEARGSADLTIEDIRAAVLEHNLDLRVALIDPEISRQNLSAEEAAFESLIFVNGQYALGDDVTTLTTESNSSERYSLEPGLRIPLRTGGSAEVSTPFSRNENDNQFAILNPSYSTDLEFSLSQPLLRGAGRRANTAAIRIADLSLQQTEARTKLEIITLISAADRAYWNLYSARQALGVRYQAYEFAREQLERAEREVAAGRQPEIEITRARSALADRIEAIITAQTDVLLRQRELKRLANIPGLGVGSKTNVVTMTDPDPVRLTLDGPALAAQALQRRMELLDLELQIASEAVTTYLRRNEALPLLTASVLYRVNGLGEEFTEAVRVASENRFEDVQLGFNAEIPLGNQQARARVRQAIIQRLQTISSKEARQQLVTEEVLDAVDNIDNGWQRILAARQSVALATRTVEAERRQFDAGRNTSNDVLDAEVQLQEARLAEIDAVVQYQISQIDLAQATGTLLGHAKIDIETIEWEPLDPRGLPPTSDAAKTGPDPRPAEDPNLPDPGRAIDAERAGTTAS